MSFRRGGWTLVELCLAMMLGLGAVVSVSTRAQAQAASAIPTTTVTDTVYRADGTAAGGTVLISWPAFTTAAGSNVPAGSTSVTIGAEGALSVALAANSGSTPMGSYYTVVYHLDDGSVTREYWVVPSQAAATTVSAIKSTVLPASVAMQTVSKAYVDTAIASAVTGHPLDTGSPYVLKTGDTMTGPLVLPGDPAAPLQASDKQYVDEQVSGLTTGLAQKVSTMPSATQTVAQPAGTQLDVNILNGQLHANDYVSGAGNNGIANAAASVDCANGCEIRADQNYPSTEVAAPTTWNNKTHVEDDRGGGVTESFFNPLPPASPGLNAARTINLSSTQSAASVHALTGSADIFSVGQQINEVALAGGSNQFPATVQGAIPYFKSTYTGLQLVGTNYTLGQHDLFGEQQDCYGVGDCLMGGMFMRASGGFRDNADEGSHPFDRSFTEDPRVFDGVCATGCSSGSTLLQVSATASAGTQGEGRYLLDTNPAKILSTGSIIGGVPTGGRQPLATFSGTSFPVSTFLETAQAIPTQANVIAPGTVTVAIVTSGAPTGFATNTAALPATSGVACVADVQASDNRTLGFETAAYSVVDGSHLQLTLNRPHANGATVAVGGLCGYGLEQTVDTVNGIRQVFPVIGSPSATSLLYATVVPIVGVQGSTSAYTNINLVVATIARAGNVVTVTTVGNPPADLNGLTLTVQGVSDASYNGNFTVTTTGPNSLTYAETGANSTSSGGTLSVITGGFALYPMAEVLGVYNAATKAVDGQMTLAANTVPWAAGDSVEEPHYFQERVSGDEDIVTQYTPRRAEVVTAGMFYGGNNGPGLYGWQVQNATPASNYFGNGGTHTVPSAGINVAGIWSHSLEAQAGEQAVVAVHCNSHGCNNWNSGYNLFQMDTGVGQDTMSYSPATSALNFNLRGTGYQFTPTSLTAGTINVTTLNAGTVHGAFAGTIGASSLPVFGASGTTHNIGAVPDPGATAGTTRFLREDGTWVNGNGVVTSASGFSTTGPTALPQRSNLLGEYLLAEGTGSVAHDTSGQGNDGSITGASWEGTTDLNFTDMASFVQMPTSVNAANTFQFAIYEPPFGTGSGPLPPGYGGEFNFPGNNALLCGTDSTFGCLIATSVLNGLVSPRFDAFFTSHTESCEPLSAGWHVVTFVNGQAGALDHWYFDGAEVPCYISQGSGGITHPTAGHYQIGGSNEGGGTFWTGKVAAAWAWSTSLSASDVETAAAAASSYVRSKGGFTQYRPVPHANPEIVAGIDSLTSGCCGISNPSKAWLVNLALTDTAYSSNTINLAQGGTLAYDHAAMFDMLYAPVIGSQNAGASIVVLWGGLNDYRHGLPVQSVMNSLKAMVQKSKALGARVVLATPISDNWSGADASYKDVLAATLRQQAFSWGVDNLADLTTIPQLGADNAYASSTYFADGIHPTDAGELLVDAVFSNAINELIGSTETFRHSSPAATYAEAAGDRYLDLTGTAAQTVTLPDCTGYSLPRQIVNLGSVSGTVGPVSGQTLTGSTAIAAGVRAMFVPVPGAPASGGCHWQRTE